MKFKLDENIGARSQSLFIKAGHDVQTVRYEGLQGAIEQRLWIVEIGRIRIHQSTKDLE